MKAKKSLTANDEWRLISEIGWDAPKLKALLPSLKDSRNIEEVKGMLKQLDSTQRTGKYEPTGNNPLRPIISQDGLIQITDNASSVNYKIGKFSYFCEDNTVIVTKDTKDGVNNIAFYKYKTDDEALNAGWKMAKRQESVEKEVLKQQKQAVKTTLAAAKKPSTQTVKVKSN